MAGKSTSTKKLTHIDPAGRPAMVDVTDKAITARLATAVTNVVFPKAVAKELIKSNMATKKGAIIDTAIIAGTMAVKRTDELIPFCHALPIDGIKILIDWHDSERLRISCTVKTQHRTGVEMEALMGASIAALTIYDMCKALSQDIEIGPTRLVEKRGGKTAISKLL
ncbi:MAG: cyclic pyranopterin monophosphate synthase MoaC [Arenimonas sp.]